jgi:hypothetical protein
MEIPKVIVHYISNVLLALMFLAVWPPKDPNLLNVLAFTTAAFLLAIVQTFL